MASLERRNQTYRIVFRHLGTKYSYSLDITDPATADALLGGVKKL